MSGTFIFIVVMVITVLLGRYAIAEGRRLENQKKFWKNIDEFENKRPKKK